VTHLVQILLPTRDNDGAVFPGADFERVARELTERFGGVTAFTRSPADGRWKPGERDAQHDEIVVIEVMEEGLDRQFWRAYRAELARRFRQDVIVIRAQGIELL
jgi:hypothetical protein